MWVMMRFDVVSGRLDPLDLCTKESEVTVKGGRSGVRWVHNVHIWGNVGNRNTGFNNSLVGL